MKKVVILGGGISGLTAAHELAERGYKVILLEKNNILGGKARSFYETSDEGNNWPSEHGFRFFLKWYANLHDTLKRIPTEVSKNKSVYDNLIPVDAIQVDQYEFSFVEHQPIPIDPPIAWIKSLTASKLRIENDYEHISWDDFVDEHRIDENDHTINFFKNTPKVTASVHSREANVRALQYTLSRVLQKPGLDVLNGPTNDAWINHWQRYLEKLGVEIYTNTVVEKIDFNGKLIELIEVKNQFGRTETITADHYVSALPHEVFSQFLSQDLKTNSVDFEKMQNLKSDWQAGVVFYMDDKLNLVKGHFGLSNSPWALSGIEQSEFWEENFSPDKFGSGECKSILSIIIADWHTKGEFVKKPAKHCSLDEIEQEIWYQLKKYSTGKMHASFKEAKVLHKVIDESIKLNGQDSTNSTPLFMNIVGSWDNRPNATSEIENLFITGDFAKTKTYLATMESANESSRLATNAILGKDDFDGDYVPLFSDNLDEPSGFLRPFCELDHQLYLEGRPHFLDSLTQEETVSFVNAIKPLMSYDGQVIKSLDTLTYKFTTILERLKGQYSDFAFAPLSLLGFDDLSKPLKKDRSDLMKRISEWGNVNMLLVDKMPVSFPSNLSAYLDTNNPVYEPLKYTIEQKGSMHRVIFAMGLNKWIHAPMDKLVHLLELGQSIHNCSLLIDDIMDNTHTRRNSEAAHLKFGVNQTIGAAYTAFFKILLSTHINLGEKCLIAFLEESSRAHLGQSVDVYTRDNNVCMTEDEYLEMVSNKTGSFFRVLITCMCELSSKNLDEDTKLEFYKLGNLIGIFFQIRDDYLDLTSQEYANKKGTFASDFEEGKFSFPVVHCISNNPSLKGVFDDTLSKATITHEEKLYLLELLKEHGSIDYTLKKLQSLYVELKSCILSIEASLKKPNEKMIQWVDKMAHDIPGFNAETLKASADTAVKKEKYIDPLSTAEINTYSLERAIRNVMSSYHLYYVSNNWSKTSFWECFPLLLTVECMIFTVDDSNEESKDGPAITQSSMSKSHIWKIIESSRYFTPELEEITKDALKYYGMEYDWRQGRTLDLDEIKKMNHLKSTNFRIMYHLSKNIIDEIDSSIGEEELTNNIEDYISLLIEESEYAEDTRSETYNVLVDFEKYYGNENFYRHYEAFKSELLNTLGDEHITTAKNWHSIIAKNSNSEERLNTEMIQLSFRNIYLAARKIADSCIFDQDLSDFALKGNIKWMLNEFKGNKDQLMNSDPILQKIQNDALIKLSN